MTTYNTGNPIGSKDPRDLYDNAENLDVLVNDTNRNTHPDRFGVSRLTWKGIIESGTGNPAIAVKAAQDALKSENVARNYAGSASSSAARAESARDKAEGYRDDAREARDAVMNTSAVSSANIYLSVSEGLSGTGDGDMFWVLPNEGDEITDLTLFENNGGNAIERFTFYNLNQFMITEGDIWE